jgi:hypothetical protein
MSQPTLDPVAGDGVPDSTADHKADARPVSNAPLIALPFIDVHFIAVPFIEASSMDDQRRTTHAESAPGRSPKVLRAAHSQ